MAVKKVTQSQLNNNTSGNIANDLYKATHGGSLGGTYVTEVQPSGNYTSRNGGTVTYNLGSGVNLDQSVRNSTTTPPGGDPKNPSGGTNSSSGYGYSYSSGGEYGGGGGMDYASMIASMLAQQRAAAQAAYDASVGRLNEAWANTQNSLSSNLNSTLDSLKRNYKYGEGVAKDDAAKSLREAYINYMMNKRNLNQNLAAAGMSGGATESSLAKLFNNYGTSRNGINTTLANNLAELLNNYQNNTASANQLYNQQYADAMNNYVNQLNSLEQMLANNVMSSYSGSSLSSLANYASTLAGLQNAMSEAAGAYTPTQNTLEINRLNTTQGNDMGSITDYAKYQNMMQNLMAQGNTADNAVYQLAQQGVPVTALYSLLGAAS